MAEHKLIDTLWPDAGLEPATCWVDCWALERALGSNAKGTSSEALGERIRHLYRGHFLQGDDDAPWALHLRERLHVSVVAALNKAAQGTLAQGDVELATRLYELGLHVDDLVEDFYAGLIRCHALSG